MAITDITLILDLDDGTGRPVTIGSAIFTPNVPLTDVADGMIVTRQPVTAAFTAAGFPSVELLPTDNPNLEPAGWEWQAVFHVQGGLASYEFPLPAGPVDFTATHATPAVFSFTPVEGGLESLPDGTGVQLAGGSLPGGFVAATTYYVVSASGETFELAATSGGSPIASTSSGPGTAQVVQYSLSALQVPEQVAPPVYASMQEPAGTPTAGQVPVATGIGDETEWGDASGGGDVTTVFGRSGDVTAQSGDYTAAEVGADASGAAAAAQTAAETYAASQASAAAAAAEAASLPELTANVTVSANGTLAIDTVTEAVATSGPLTMTLPTSVPGALIVCEKADASTNTVTVSGLIRGSSSTVVLKLLDESEMFFGFGGSWWPIAGHKTLASLDARYDASGAAAAAMLAPTSIKTGAYTAAPGDFVPCDVSGGSFTVTLPAAPADKSRVAVKMVKTAGANTLTIARGGSDTFNDDLSTSGTLKLLNQGLIAQYSTAAGVWYVQADDLPLSQTDARYAQLTGATFTGPVIATSIAASGITGTSAAARLVGAGTGYGPPSTGTFNQFDGYFDGSGNIWVCTVAGSPGTWMQVVPSPASYFYPERAGAVHNGKIVCDGAITSGFNTLTTPGLSAPSAPSPTFATTGGTVAAGVYQVQTTYVNANGETTGSTSGSVTTTGGTSTITVPSPASSASAVAWFAYVTAVGGSTFFRQQNPALPTAVGTNLVITAPPTTTGANPPGANTTASNPFTINDVGKSIHVGGAGGSVKIPLCTTITGFNNSGSVTLNVNASSTVSGGITAWATDDIPAINTTVASAVAYGMANSCSVKVVYQAGIYGCGSAPTIGGATLGNAQIPLPVVSITGRKLVLEFAGAGDGTTLSHWLQGTPAASGSVLMCLRNDGTQNATFGPSHIIGGPFAGFGNGSANFTNLKFVASGLTTLTPWNGTYGGIDLLGVAEADVDRCSHMSLAVPATNGPVPSMANIATITNFGVWGLRMPTTNNNAVATIGRYTAEGCVFGVGLSEHTSFEYMELNYNYSALYAFGGANGLGGIAHFISGRHVVIGEVENALFTPATSGVIKIKIDLMSVENIGLKLVNDADNILVGEVGYGQINGSAGVTGAANLRLTNLAVAVGPWTTAPTAPATGAAQQNTSGRHATVTVLSTATITAVTVTSLAAVTTTIMTGASVPAGTPVYVSVPNLQSYTVTSAGGTLTTGWVLD